MKQTVTDAQRHMVLSVLMTAMAILRDDQPFNPKHTVFGRNFAAEPLFGNAVGTEYSFENPAFPSTQITLVVAGDPTDRAAERMRDTQVPRAFVIRFDPMITGIMRSTLEDLFPLDIGYWVDGKGNRQFGNDMGAVPPQVRVHHYRYRASAQPASRFPVDVQLVFGDPKPQAAGDDEPKTPVLMDVLLTRDYFKPTPDRRR
ncbi:hypothetical protein [Paraburkholderia antibiotica]|uniref:Uncharacterized protein n=1 Tax=Paraburkholderia antibiotica TaxID=2728839 RepID=A0A7X9ZXY4_9BURK|nr:hypothetical protein [Paraburkholderia antibiotica]NML32589.1 hypothetical protein [Paraburkholderia antibiotica]